MSYNSPTLRVLNALGIADKRLPVNGTFDRFVVLDGVEYFVVARTPLASRRSHRLMARCWCGKTVSAGRIGQHSKVHKP